MRLGLAPVRRLLGVLLALSLVGSACSMVGLGGRGDSYTLTAFFSRTINLYETSQVRVLGLEAGVVTEIAEEGDRIRVVLEMDEDTPVPAGVHATIVPFSLIGERYVQLFPAWTEGMEAAADGDEIPLDRTTVPVEPDEALAALKEFLDSLDPDGTGRLVTNLSEALDGQGASLNRAFDGLSKTLSALAAEDQSLADLVDQFDDFTATLVTREGQLGEIMDGFAEATGVLADERESVRTLVQALGDLSGDALDLVSEHGGALETDLDILGRVLRSVTVNLDRVEELLRAGPVLVSGLRDAYSPEYHRIDLRNQYSPTASQAVEAIGGPVLPQICIPADVGCSAPAPSPASTGSTSSSAEGSDAAAVPVPDVVASGRGGAFGRLADRLQLPRPVAEVRPAWSPDQRRRAPKGDGGSVVGDLLGAFLGVDW